MKYKTNHHRLAVIWVLLSCLALPAQAINWDGSCQDEGSTGRWTTSCPPNNSETNWDEPGYPSASDRVFVGPGFYMVMMDDPNPVTILSIENFSGLELPHDESHLVLTDGLSVIRNLYISDGFLHAYPGVTVSLEGDSYLEGHLLGGGFFENTGNLYVGYDSYLTSSILVNQSNIFLESGAFVLENANAKIINFGNFQITGSAGSLSGSDAFFVNNGSMSMHRPESIFSFHPNYIQRGMLLITGGALALNSLTTDFASGEITVQSGASLELGNNSSAPQDHRFSGLNSINGMGIVENNQDYTVLELLFIDMGSGDPQTGSGGFLNNGALSLQSSVYNSGRFRLDDCLLAGGSTFYNEPGSWVYTRDTHGGTIECNVSNRGNFQLNGGSINISSSYPRSFTNFGNFVIHGGDINGMGQFINAGVFVLELPSSTETSVINCDFRLTSFLSNRVEAVMGILNFTGQFGALDETGKLNAGFWQATSDGKIIFPRIVNALIEDASINGPSASFPNVDIENIGTGAHWKSSDWEILHGIEVEGGELTVEAGGSGIIINGTLVNIEGGKVSIESEANLDLDYLQNGDGHDSVIPELASIVVLAKSGENKDLGEPATITTAVLDNYGRIAPGEQNGIGTLHLVGNLNQFSTGVLDVDLNGLVPDSEHDQFTVNGNATLDGLVNVRLAQGFWPTVGQEFTILTVTGSIAGSFTGIVSSPGVSFSLRHEATRVVLVTDEVTGPSPVPEIHTGFHLAAAVPNPFNPMTNLSFNLPEELPVSFRIYDLSGHLVRNLLTGRVYPEGQSQVRWDGRNDRGSLVSAGVYLYRLEAGAFSDTKRMTLVK